MFVHLSDFILFFCTSAQLFSTDRTGNHIHQINHSSDNFPTMKLLITNRQHVPTNRTARLYFVFTTHW